MKNLVWPARALCVLVVGFAVGFAVVVGDEPAIAAPPPTSAAPASSAPDTSAEATAPASAACALDPGSAARAVTAAYAALRDLYRRRLPGPAGGVMLRRELARLVDAHVDVDTFLRNVLRGIWEAGDEPQRRRWRMALEGVLRSRYLTGIDAPPGQRMQVLRSLVSCDQAAVRVAFAAPGRGLGRPGQSGQPSRAIDMALIYRGERWRVHDVSFDGVSLARSWRSRFMRIYRDGGVAAVDRQISRLAERYGVALPPPPEPVAEPPEDADTAAPP